MHRVPTSRWRFGAPEIVLLLAGLAVIVPVTAWWHAFCQPRETFNAMPVASARPSLDAPANAQTFTAVGYIVPGEVSISGTVNHAPVLPPTGPADINVLLLFCVAVIMLVPAAIYAIKVYPEVRRTPRARWV